MSVWHIVKKNLVDTFRDIETRSPTLFWSPLDGSLFLWFYSSFVKYPLFSFRLVRALNLWAWGLDEKFTEFVVVEEFE